MEEIRKFVDSMITWAGITGDYVPMLRHILLTIIAVLLAMLSDFLCRKILVPLISKITEKTEFSWDDVLLNRKVLTSAWHLYRGDVGAYGIGVYRFVQGIGEQRGAPVFGSAVFPYLLRCAQNIDALRGWSGGGSHPAG